MSNMLSVVIYCLLGLVICWDMSVGICFLLGYVLWDISNANVERQEACRGDCVKEARDEVVFNSISSESFFSAAAERYAQND